MFTQPHALIVEDEPMVSDLLKEIGIEEGFRISIAVTGNEAFSMIAANNELYDCVFLDLGLPGMQGEEVIQHLARLNSKAKIIICSASIDYEEL